jgi:hypothetical protein
MAEITELVVHAGTVLAGNSHRATANLSSTCARRMVPTLGA